MHHIDTRVIEGRLGGWGSACISAQSSLIPTSILLPPMPDDDFISRGENSGVGRLLIVERLGLGAVWGFNGR